MVDSFCVAERGAFYLLRLRTSRIFILWIFLFNNIRLEFVKSCFYAVLFYLTEIRMKAKSMRSIYLTMKNIDIVVRMTSLNR